MDLGINEIFGFPAVNTVKSALGFPAKVTGPSPTISKKPPYGRKLVAIWLNFMTIPGWLSEQAGGNAQGHHQGHHHLHGGLIGCSRCMNYIEK